MTHFYFCCHHQKTCNVRWTKRMSLFVWICELNKFSITTWKWSLTSSKSSVNVQMKLVGPMIIFSKCKILVASAYENLELSHLKFSQFFDMIHSQQIAIPSLRHFLKYYLLYSCIQKRSPCLITKHLAMLLARW